MKITTLTLAALLPLSAAAQGAPGAHFIENWDLDANGTVTLAELEQRRSDVFYMFDMDEDGALDAAEYVSFDAVRAADMASQGGHGTGKMGRVQEGLTLLFNDTDDDGQVSEAEFLAMTSEWLTLIDRDRSGDVTAADFGPRS
ncbi:MAG: EF-hand domain-containing protein [Yoonia sp.]|uniref:EF-hand domain-containing protein n=1 Tax=Yoonia sp. TaxID=2212373 RepID=UPI003EF4F3E5